MGNVKNSMAATKNDDGVAQSEKLDMSLEQINDLQK